MRGGEQVGASKMGARPGAAARPAVTSMPKRAAAPASRPAARAPAATGARSTNGSAATNGAAQAQIDDLSNQMMEMKLTVEGLEKERDFYFGN